MTDTATDPEDSMSTDGGAPPMRITEREVLAALDSDPHADDAGLLYAIRLLHGAADDGHAGADAVAQAGLPTPGGMPRTAANPTPPAGPQQPVDSAWPSLLRQYRPDIAADQPDFHLSVPDAKPLPTLPVAGPQPSGAAAAPSWLQPFLAPAQAPIFVQPWKQADPAARPAAAPAPTAAGRIDGGFDAVAANPNPPSWLQPLRAPIFVQPWKQADPAARPAAAPAPAAAGRIDGGRPVLQGAPVSAPPGTGGGAYIGDTHVFGVDQRLQEIVQAAATHLPPGYRVSMTNGYRGPQEPNHNGNAADFHIIDPEGHVLSNEGEDPSGMYQTLARHAYGEMLARYPELQGSFGWGGAFGKKTKIKGGGGPRDLMHFDVNGDRGAYTRYQLRNMGPVPGVNYGPQP